MKCPAVSELKPFSLAKRACVAFCLASLFFFGGATRAQQGPQKLTIKSDKNNPHKAPDKSARTATQTNQTAAEPTTTATNTMTANDATPTAPQAAASSPSGCVYGTLLLKDTIRIIYIELINYPPNSAIPVTATQTNAGIIGFALTDTGPYTPTLNIVINTDSTGYGVSAPVFTQGQAVGQTVMYGDTPYGATTTIDFNVLPQCNCPPIPIVQ
jgi:hypothetical protein